MTKLEIGLGVAVLIALAVGGFFYYQERIAEVRADEQTKANQRLEQMLTQQIADRQKQAADDKKAVDTQVSSALTLQQQVDLLNRFIKPQQPLVIQVPQAAANPQSGAHSLPDAPTPQPGVPLSPQQVKEFVDYSAACQKNSIDLNACQGNLGDVTKQRDLAKQDAKTWEKTAKGGSKAKRIVKGIGVALCSGLGGWFGSKSHNSARGAAIGATAGGAACYILIH